MPPLQARQAPYEEQVESFTRLEAGAAGGEGRMGGGAMAGECVARDGSSLRAQSRSGVSVLFWDYRFLASVQLDTVHGTSGICFLVFPRDLVVCSCVSESLARPPPP